MSDCFEVIDMSSWRSVPFGKYCRISQFVFSLVPRRHGECGSAKKTGIPVSTVNAAWADSSLPRSQVTERLNCCGRVLIEAARAFFIVIAS